MKEGTMLIRNLFRRGMSHPQTRQRRYHLRPTSCQVGPRAMRQMGLTVWRPVPGRGCSLRLAVGATGVFVLVLSFLGGSMHPVHAEPPRPQVVAVLPVDEGSLSFMAFSPGGQAPAVGGEGDIQEGRPGGPVGGGRAAAASLPPGAPNAAGAGV